ncbi:uncharacterized protein [Lolium perenne]|uniref:uncharacterized protein n=1 Tax=Lolium perenne TaxID=4522 RepID=UPI003A99B5F5
MATQRHRRNAISMLTAVDGRQVSDHAEMAGLLWSSYKERMGMSEGISMQFDLAALIEKVPGLDEISMPFLLEEMELVIKQMPSDKAPGPDGFNGHFLKKCWPIVKQQFFDLAAEFHEGSLNLQNINGSYITLVPKVQSPETVNDFRPISLTNLDFAKAFDTIENEVILQVMKHKGFDEKTIGWVKNILASGTSSVLLNGVPGKQFVCKRGVRQGDPLSPILYVLGSDLLQTVVNNMLQEGRISLPIEVNDPDFPIVQYVDDTLLIIPADLAQIVALKDVLHNFTLSTGLKINYHKSSMVPINVPAEDMKVLAEAFGLQPIMQRLPRLYSYVKEPNLTAKQVYDCPVFAELFHLPLSAQAYEEFQQVAQVMASSPLSVAADVWQYSWGKTFTASRYYQQLFVEVTVIPVFKWIWKSSCIMKHKFFDWLLLNDRLNTRDLLKRRHWKSEGLELFANSLAIWSGSANNLLFS